MARSLSVARVRVGLDKQGEYLSALRELAVLGSKRGQHIWVFKSQRTPDTFLEFSESPTPMSHRNIASRTPEEIRLEQRLHNVAAYDNEAGDLWEEVPLDILSET